MSYTDIFTVAYINHWVAKIYGLDNISILSTIQARLMSAALFLVALPAHILNSLARNSWFHSVFLQFANEVELRWIWTVFNVSIITCSWWILEDCFCSIAPYRFNFCECRLSCRFLSFSKSSKIHNETVSCRSYCYCRACILREFIFFCVMSSKTQKT